MALRKEATEDAPISLALVLDLTGDDTLDYVIHGPFGEVTIVDER